MKENSSGRKNFLIAALSIALLVAILVILKMAGTRAEGFRGSMKDQTAVGNVDKYRNTWSTSKKSYGTWYDTEEIRFYIDSVYPKLVQLQTDSIKNYLHKHPDFPFNMDEYQWRVGFYWMRNKDRDNKSKHDFCVAPTLVHKTDSTRVCDYFNTKDYPFYSHRIKFKVPKNNKLKPIILDGEEGYVFNTGTLFP